MTAARLALGVALALSLAACARTLSLVVPPAAPVTVYADGEDRTCEPGSAEYARIADWIAANRSGWSSYTLTRPAGGVFIQAPGIDIQVLGSTAYARTPDGVFTKSIDPAALDLLGE